MSENQVGMNNIPIKEIKRFKRNAKIMLACAITVVAVIIGFEIYPLMVRPTWHETANFTGKFEDHTNERSGSFHVSSEHWRIHWTAISDLPIPEDVCFQFLLLDGSEMTGHVAHFRLRQLTISDFWSDTCVEIEYVTGSGTFSLIVYGTAVRWSITIEEYY